MKRARKRPVENTDLSRLGVRATSDIIVMFKDRLQWFGGERRQRYQAAISELKAHERTLQR